MGLRYRPMRPKDVRECAEIIAAHAVIGPRYGSAIADLRPAWRRLLSCEAKRATVFEQVERSQATICAVGVSVFVHDDFVRELKTPPLFWFGPELVKRILRGDSPILSDKQLQKANSCGGLNLLVWEGCIRAAFEKDGEIHRGIMSAFIEEHRGFLWKEVISSQMESEERLQWTLAGGGARLWDPANARYVDSLHQDPKEIMREPHILGLTRNTKLWGGSWVDVLFDYHPPRCCFSRSEQRLLLLALSGGTDEELSDGVRTSLSTIKNTWRSIYNRAASRLPELFPDHSKTGVRSPERGKEKRRALLAYLREHSEELRPVSQKLLQQTATQPRLGWRSSS